jgi:ribonuclease HI
MRDPDSALARDRERTVTVSCPGGGARDGAGADLDRRCVQWQSGARWLGALLRYGEVEKELCGGESTPTTNNRMELTAPIRALTALTRASVVDLYTDSTYVRNGIRSWMANWKRNGWRTKAGQPVKNEDLWRELDVTVARHDEVVWHWVKGHADHVENERADRLAARGQRGALEAAGVPVSPLPEPRRQAAPRVTATGEGALCRAKTKVGKPCPITARPSGFCHVHDGSTKPGADQRVNQADSTEPGADQSLRQTGGGSNPERFVRKPPQPAVLPTAAWINKPTDQTDPNQTAQSMNP